MVKKKSQVAKKQRRKLTAEFKARVAQGWAGCIKPNTNASHINPVKHRYARRAVDWPNSTIHRFIERGVMGAFDEREIEVR